MDCRIFVSYSCNVRSSLSLLSLMSVTKFDVDTNQPIATGGSYANTIIVCRCS